MQDIDIARFLAIVVFNNFFFNNSLASFFFCPIPLLHFNFDSHYLTVLGDDLSFATDEHNQTYIEQNHENINCIWSFTYMVCLS